MRITLSEILAKDEAGGYSDADFDDALWLVLCDRINSVNDLEKLPSVVQVYYTSRYVEWEVGNGGFAQAVLNVPEYLEPAAQAFEVLGKTAIAERIREALRIYDEEATSLPEVRPGNEPIVSEYFMENAFNHLDEGLDELGFWSDKERLAFVRAHRHDFAQAV